MSVFTANSIDNYVSSIVTRIQTGDYSEVASQWINCTNVSLGQRSFHDEFNPNAPTLGRRSTAADLECPLQWAQDSNTYVCSTGASSSRQLCRDRKLTSRTLSVVFNGYTASDLGGAYYLANAPVVDEQIAKVCWDSKSTQFHG